MRAVIVLFAIAALHAQTGAATAYVASVKPNNSADARTFSEYYPGGRLSATAITVRDLLRIAYRIQRYQLVGAPAWFSTKRYDIAAKAEYNPAPSQQVLLRALLADRFKLTTHNETRDLPIFALTLARNDGRPGPQLHKSDFDCAAYLASPHALPDPAKTPPCGARSNLGSVSAKSISMAQLATILDEVVGRFTVDKTGLPGGFDVELTWTPEQTAPDSPDAAGPSIFTALQEQLGLKLVPAKGPVDVLVVDHAEEPEAN